MSRIHLFEFEDLSWFPKNIRNYGTDFLQFLSNKTKMYQPIVPLLTQILKEQNENKIIDLASGGGGGLLSLNNSLKAEIPELQIYLTDFYPNIPAFQHTQKQADNFNYIQESIDAKKVPEHLVGLRTQFLSLHHFKPKDAVQILQNAVDSKSSIAIFEAQERSFSSILAMFFSPLTLLLSTPFIRPFKWGRLLFTYLIPVVPILVWWDGIVSALRTYSVKELNQLVDKVKNNTQFNWEIKRIKSGPGIIIYLIGTPK